MVSAAGDVVLGAGDVNGSLVLEGGKEILGAAPTLSFTAAAAETTTTTGGGGRGGGGGYLNLTAGAAKVGVLPGEEGRGQGGTSIEADHEVIDLLEIGKTPTSDEQHSITPSIPARC